tara:strand:+ start:5447 stop:5866 length:420 start_codon:yes stop_codon:yes gene_type:complete
MAIDKLIEDIISLRTKKQALEAELRPIASQLKELEETVVNEFLSRQIQNLKQFNHTIFVSRDLSVRSVDGNVAPLISHLLKTEMHDLLNVNWSTIKAFVKEKMYDPQSDSWEMNPSKLPADFSAAIDMREYHRLNVRKS